MIAPFNFLHQMIAEICMRECFDESSNDFKVTVYIYILLINILPHFMQFFRSVCEAGRDVSVTFILTLSMLTTKDHEGKG